MRAHTVGKKNVILNRDVTSERHFVGKNIIVADNAVVCDVYSHHEKVARTYASRLPCSIGPVKGAKLADDIVVPNLEVARLPLELHILWLAANHRMLKDAITGTQTRKALDHR